METKSIAHWTMPKNNLNYIKNIWRIKRNITGVHQMSLLLLREHDTNFVSFSYCIFFNWIYQSLLISPSDFHSKILSLVFSITIFPFFFFATQTWPPSVNRHPLLSLGHCSPQIPNFSSSFPVWSLRAHPSPSITRTAVIVSVWEPEPTSMCCSVSLIP